MKKVRLILIAILIPALLLAGLSYAARRGASASSNRVVEVTSVENVNEYMGYGSYTNMEGVIISKDTQTVRRNGEYSLKKIYDFDLQENGGHISGWLVEGKDVEEFNAVLADYTAHVADKYVGLKGTPMVFAVGDGNHSLATAKECYNQSKNPLARYALVEVVNIHDESIEFEPIYRVLFNVDAKDFIEKFTAYTEKNGGDTEQTFRCITPGSDDQLTVKATAKLPVGTLQTFIDGYMQENPQVKMLARRISESVAEARSLDGLIAEALSGDATYECLLTVPGIGPRTASELVIGIDISEFPDHDHLASYCGVAPRNRRSGTSISSVSASRQGNKRLKNLLIFSCNSLVRSRSRFGEYYRACRGRGMCHGEALKAVARKRVKVIYAIMRDKVPYAA